MESDTSRVIREAEEAASGGATRNILDSVGNRIGAHADAHAVFGDPIERDGVTVIPVAKVRWGFGGGGGMGWDGAHGHGGQEHKHEEGSEHEHHPHGGGGEGGGGGGGVSASPVGFIEIRDGQASFHRVPDPASLVGLIIASGFSAWLTLRGLKRLVRG